MNKWISEWMNEYDVKKKKKKVDEQEIQEVIDDM